MHASMVRSLTARMPFALAALLVVCLPAMAAISPTYAQPLQAETDFAAVDAYVEAQRQALHIPGLALAIVQGDQVTYLHGYGQAAPDGRAVTAQTPFMIGSVTKSFTALAIMQLVEAGQVALDAPVQIYLPWFRVANPHASAQITIRHLLNQTSGFSEGSGLQEELASDLSDTAIEAVVRRLADASAIPPAGRFTAPGCAIGCAAHSMACIAPMRASSGEATRWKPYPSGYPLGAAVKATVIR